MNKKITLTLLSLFIIYASDLAFSSPLTECQKEYDVMADVSKCLDSKLKKAESALEQKVSEIRQKMEDQSIKTNQIYPIRSFNLSQQSYLIYRKTNCNWHFDKSFPNTGSSQLLKDCLIRMTLDRILELESFTDSPAIKTDDSVQKQSNNKKTSKRQKKASSSEREMNDRDSSNRQSADTMQGYADNKIAEIKDDLDERCYLKPDPGTCGEFIMKYYYYVDGDNCSSFIWSGCDGVVPFETMNECRTACK